MNHQLSPGQLSALCYADVFDYPLTWDELRKFQTSCHSGRRAGIYINNYINPQVKPKDDIQNKKGFYFLKRREGLVTLRKEREKWSGEKLKIAKQVVRYISKIPTVRMVAVTGALAMNNCEKNDDIDLLIVAKNGTVWTTRFLTIIFLELLGKRRRPNQRHVSNKICLNMFLDENHLQVPDKEQDIFSAHEVAQVKVLWEREETVRRFWKENEWIKNFLPNIYNSKKLRNYDIQKYKKNISVSYYLQIIELILSKFQLFYMRKRRTNEILRDGYLRFHPNDARKWILREYAVRLRNIGLE